MIRILLLLVLCLPLGACYYMQAASGQWQVLRKRVPLEDVIADPHTAPELADRLQLLAAARDFSVAELRLPDNKSYRTYADLERDYVVWNVFAVPEFSLQAKTWCFPVAGCVSYRGYFSKDKALKESQRLADDGFDVAVGGVAAYSTLGKFSDPILSSMMHWDDVDLVAVLFHELAHQVVYVKDDSAFNESFATAVEEFGVQRWLRSRGDNTLYVAYVEKRAYQQRLTELVADARVELQRLYASDDDDDSKRRLKKSRFALLASAVAEEARRSGREASGWLTSELNNAHLVSTVLYEGYLPSFRAVFAQCGDDISCFYAETEKLAGLDKEQRITVLEALSRR